MTQTIGPVLIRWDVLLLVWGLFGLGALLIAARQGDKSLMWKKYLVYFLIVHLVFAAIALGWAGIAATVILVGGIDEVWHLRSAEKKMRWWKFGIALLVFLPIIFGFLFFCAKSPPAFLWVIYASVVIFDGISQLGGQAIGRIRFVPRISPNKTLEGFLIGWVCSFTACMLLEGGTMTDYILFALIGPVALAGDLLASWYKRIAGVKDYGAWIPGHGGILDRFDSFVMVGASLFYGGLVWLAMNYG